MPKEKKGKKGNKSKKNKVEEPPRKLITREELIAQETKFNLRLEAVWETQEKMKVIRSALHAGARKKSKEDAWKKYLSCDGLPNPSIPAEIREFLSKWQHYEDLDAKEKHSWLLKVNERSILTQDIDAVNNTKKHLKALQEDQGNRYNEHIKRMLTVLQGIRKVLESSKKLPSSIYADLLKLKDDMLKAIQECIDIFTFRLIRDAAAHLNDLDSVTADYHFKSPEIKFHLWSFKHVPIHFLPDLWPKEKVKMHALKTQIILPFAVLCDNLTLRGLHTKYDHYSEFTKSINMPEIFVTDEDIDKVLTKEWEKRTELRNNEITEMTIQRKLFEAQKAEEEEEKKEQETRKKKEANTESPKKGGKKKGGKKKGEKKLKFSYEPIKLDDNTFPDIENDFCAFDDQQYLEFLNSCSYLLEEGEVNLREYILMGGIYEFNFVQKPRQTNFPNLIITWLEHPVVLKYKNKNCFLKTVDFSSIGIETHQRGGANAEDDDFKDEKTQQAEAYEFQTREPPLTFFIITFKVPYEICRWQDPIVCQWYEVPETQERTQEVRKKINDGFELQTPVVINDFVLSRTLEIPMMFHIINHLVPRFTSVHQFPEELNIEKRRATKKKFALEEVEIGEKEDKEEQIVKVPADRLFPIFKAIKPVVIIPMEEGTLTQQGIKDQTIKLFSDYVNELEHIKFTKLPLFKKAGPYTPSHRKPKDTDDTISYISAYSTKSAISHKSISVPSKTEKKPQGDKTDKKSKKNKKKTKKIVQVSSRQSLKKDEVKRLVHYFDTVEEHNPEEEEEEEDEDNISQADVDSDKESVDSKVECSAETIEYPKWSTKNVFKTEFDREKLKVRIWTNRLGVFALAFKRYIHLPFRVWTIQPDNENYKVVKFYAEGKYARFCVDITEEGYNFQILDYKLSKGLPIVIYENETTISKIETLKKEMQSRDINIFPEKDATLYIKHIPEKHLPIENHTYECIGLVCMFMQFCISAWNRVSGRRVIIIKCRSFEEDISALETVKITPEECQIVTVKELCTDLDQVVLHFSPTARNLKYNPDLLSLINASYFRVISNLEYHQMYNPRLQNNVIEFLKAVRPISFSR